ncbi:putative flavoprotein oxidoreductase [Methylotuvimicrobium alcaliphilum 20Z]|uniref:Flavoprotein oxidoreductase n=1 Tax=Methylotuvimicrobium alcaliphilum (strain DSM 19304 / NCIMB 14124 / VKM B-2133 / 20Z) TaxID=1091494 RepID=G4SZJ8_META2|nr:putative flavoprotein oxidoreductase [Methylotuvimicrobium alcaliphilum 20Z]
MLNHSHLYTRHNSRRLIQPFVAIIGGGPAGLMAAEALSQSGVRVDVYDAMPSVGRKFLMAGKGGMNITHSEAYDIFLSRYGKRSGAIKPMLDAFGPDQLRKWLRDLGVETFIGSSGRVFPTDMKAAPLLRAWLHRLRETGVTFHMRHRWQGWSETGELIFLTPQGEKSIRADATVLALGGGSWSKLGSDGVWVDCLVNRNIPVAPLRPSNCGFETAWSDRFREAFAGQAVKSVAISVTAGGTSNPLSGEFTITQYGVEGSLIYAFSSQLREQIDATGQALMLLDLLPETDLQALIKKLSRPRGKNSLANFLRKSAGIKGVKAALLRELADADDYRDMHRLASKIKALPIRLTATRPLDEAISSAGGVMFEALDDCLMLKDMPGVFCSGEMLDWEAPTGGYLLTACFASGFAAGHGVLEWLGKLDSGKR